MSINKVTSRQERVSLVTDINPYANLLHIKAMGAVFPVPIGEFKDSLSCIFAGINEIFKHFLPEFRIVDFRMELKAKSISLLVFHPLHCA